MSAGDAPASVTTDGSAPADSSNSTSSTSPCWAAAWIGVKPPFCVALTSAPAAIRTRQTSMWPPAAALWSGWTCKSFVE